MDSPERPKRQRPVAHAAREHTAFIACKLPPALKARFVAVCYARGDLPGPVTRKLIEAFTIQQEKKR
jgi:hypothetical protein